MKVDSDFYNRIKVDVENNSRNSEVKKIRREEIEKKALDEIEKKNKEITKRGYENFDIEI